MSEQLIVWQILGIAATRDISSIRKAYASRLKECHPEEDPVGFQRLRTAYETALHMARGASAAAAAERPTGLSAPTVAATRDPLSSVASAPIAAEDDNKRFAAAFSNLVRLLKSPADASAETLERALDDILDNPGALHVGNWSGLDRRLAQLLLESVPRSDAIAATAVQRLGWNHADVATRRAKEVIAVVSRVADLEVVGKLRVGTDPESRAFQLLSRPAPTSWLVRRFKVFIVDQAVRDFLQKTVPARPTITLWLDASSVKTWMGIFGRPYVTRRALLAMPIFSVIALSAALIAGNNGAVTQERIGTALLLAIFAGPVLVLLKVYAFSWPILLVLRRLKGNAVAPWARLGWLPASVASVVVVSVAGPSWPVAMLSLILSGGILVWASVAAHPIFIAEGLTFSQKLQLSFGRNRMMLVWMGIIVWTVGLPAGIATAGAVGASEIAGTGVKKAWRLDTAAHVRHWFIGALSVIVLVAIIALWRVDESPRLIAFSSALVTSTVLLQRPVYIVLRAKFVDASRKAIYPFAVFTGLISNAINGSVKNATITQVAGTCMLFGVATVILSYLYQEVNSARTAASVNP